MEITPTHRIEFECTNDKDIIIPNIINPCYIYRVGDIIKRFDMFEYDEKTLGSSPLGIFKVVDVQHEALVTIDQMDQVIAVKVEKIEEKKTKS
ncbi:unnamed protein product [marine sediment metagenome]|uniref:Uncharacterized protein n=1 Tax=marine sediment metagenome TaxID=412755 RepID=X0YNG6_9ZZZZ